MKINNVAILGAGAIGAYFIWGLTPKLKDQICLVAEGERKERLETEGLRINGQHMLLPVKTPEEARGADLLIVAVKYGGLVGALDAIETIVDDHTVVLSPLNGVDSEEIIGGRIGMEHMLHSFMKIQSSRGGNQIVFDEVKTPGMYFGEAATEEQTERMLAVEELFAGTQAKCHMRPDILKQIWYKYSINVSQNQPQAIVNCGHGAYYDSEYVGKMRDLLLAEVVAVASAKGIDITAPNPETQQHAHVLKKARFSTLQDLDAKRHTEVDMFAGAMVRMGKELGVPTPYNEMVYLTIKAIEERNDGKFDYES